MNRRLLITHGSRAVLTAFTTSRQPQKVELGPKKPLVTATALVNPVTLDIGSGTLVKLIKAVAKGGGSEISEFLDRERVAHLFASAPSVPLVTGTRLFSEVLINKIGLDPILAADLSNHLAIYLESYLDSKFVAPVTVQLAQAFESERSNPDLQQAIGLWINNFRNQDFSISMNRRSFIESLVNASALLLTPLQSTFPQHPFFNSRLATSPLSYSRMAWLLRSKLEMIAQTGTPEEMEQFIDRAKICLPSYINSQFIKYLTTSFAKALVKPSSPNQIALNDLIGHGLSMAVAPVRTRIQNQIEINAVKKESDGQNWFIDLFEQLVKPSIVKDRKEDKKL